MSYPAELAPMVFERVAASQLQQPQLGPTREETFYPLRVQA